VLHGTPQVIFPGGDGCLYSFVPETGELLWKFDCNPKDAVYELAGAGSRSDFTFVSDVDQSQESTLVPAVSVQEGGTLNVTLRVDISTWFLNGAKTALVSPATANKGQPNESVVASNIQNSFKAFEDDNHDGLEDH